MIESEVVTVQNGVCEIPENITSIPSYSFVHHPGLERVIIPDNVEKIGTGVFSDCKNLKSIRLPNNISGIPESMFNEARQLEEIRIPNSVEEIGCNAFADCRALKKVDFPEKLKKIQELSFSNCQLLESIVVPKSVEKIEFKAFFNCYNLKSVAFEGTDCVLDSSIFDSCKSLQSVKLPDNLGWINNGLFYNCEKLQDIIIPDSVCTIGNMAFARCTSLKEIRLPQSLNTIGCEAFYNCKSLENLYIPDEVILNRGFVSGCDNLKTLRLLSDLHNDDVDILDGIPNSTIIEYQGNFFTGKEFEFAKKLSEGLNLSKIIQIINFQHDILQDETFSPILTRDLCWAAHSGTLESTADKIKQDFATIGFYDISNEVDLEAKEKLTKLFKANQASLGVVPRIIDALTIASTTLHIQPEDIVKAFEDKKFRAAIIAMRTCHKGNHFFDVEAVLFAMTLDVNKVKQTILRNPYKDYASVLLCEGYKNNNANALNAARWIALNPDTNTDTISYIYLYHNEIDITPEMSIEKIRKQIVKLQAESEVTQIERVCDIKISDCICNIPKNTVELGHYRAEMMDGDDPRQVILGYETSCCKHYGDAGETAMLYGLINPNAGFFVIEDKATGKILAQAETWEDTHILSRVL